MNQVPLLWSGAPVGEVTLEPDGLYTWFTVLCRPPEEGLWSAWVIGERGELRLGVLEPGEGGCGIRRRCSRQTTAPLGSVLRGELRPLQAQAAGEEWERLTDLRRLQMPWLERQLQGQRSIWLCRTGERTSVAVAYDKGKPFPVIPLVCLARIRAVRGIPCVVYTFDASGRPMLG